MSRNKTNEVLTVYLRKRKTYVHSFRSINMIKKISSFGGMEDLLIWGSELNSQVKAIFTVLVLASTKGNGGLYY